MFEAVIFDWDWTLADTKRFLISSFQKALREVGCNVSDRFIERRIGSGAKNTLREALEASDIKPTDELIEKLLERKIEVQLSLTETVRLIDGAMELLTSLYGKVRMALATMSNRPVIDRLLQEKGVGKFFDVVITVDEVNRPKPDPEIFLKCAEKMNVPPAKCVVVEDSIFGVEAARRAGMKCIAIPSGAYSIDELRERKPDLIVDSLKEKEKILNFILG
mgnify:CR=1 FL=1